MWHRSVFFVQNIPHTTYRIPFRCTKLAFDTGGVMHNRRKNVDLLVGQRVEGEGIWAKTFEHSPAVAKHKKREWGKDELFHPFHLSTIHIHLCQTTPQERKQWLRRCKLILLSFKNSKPRMARRSLAFDHISAQRQMSDTSSGPIFSMPSTRLTI